MLSVFIVDAIPDHGKLLIVGEEAHHASSVMRLNAGDEVMVTDGRGNSAHVKILTAGKKSVECEILSKERIANPQPN